MYWLVDSLSSALCHSWDVAFCILPAGDACGESPSAKVDTPLRMLKITAIAVVLLVARSFLAARMFMPFYPNICHCPNAGSFHAGYDTGQRF